jgi:hypothetical protein
MEKRSDALLRKMLKNWVNRQRPPANGRARLLWEAAHISRDKFDLTVILPQPRYMSTPSSSSNDWPQTLFSWINENSIQLRIQARIV